MLIGRAADGNQLQVSAAVDTAKAVKQQQEAVHEQVTPAYQVELSGAAESYKSHWVERGDTAYLTYRDGQSLEDELAELTAGVADLLERQKKAPPRNPNASLDNLDGKIKTVNLADVATSEISPEVRAISEELHRHAMENPLPGGITISPEFKASLRAASINTAKSQHYTWTPLTGIVENSELQALAVHDATDKLQNTLKQNISDTITDILKPYESYSKAYEVLKDSNVFVDTYAQAGNTVLQETKEISGGLFGKLASQLNDYAKNFGTDDQFFEDIKTAFGVITGDSPDKNPLLTQIEKMVRYVQSGGELDIKDKKYQEDVDEAIAKTYKHKNKAKNVEPDKHKAHEPAFKTDTSYLDNLRQQFEETAAMLDKMTDNGQGEGKHKVKTARDVLDSRAPEDSFDMEFHQQLAHVDDRNPTITDTSHGIFNHKKPVDALSEEDTNELSTLQTSWTAYVKNHNLIDSSKVKSFF